MEALFESKHGNTCLRYKKLSRLPVSGGAIFAPDNKVSLLTLTQFVTAYNPTYNSYSILVTDTWIKHSWGFLWIHKISL